MENKDALLFFKDMAATAKDASVVKLVSVNDMTDYDAAFILKFADINTSILDLGSGTGLTINKLYNNVKKITALDPFENFTKYIVQSPNVQIVNKTVLEFNPDTEYDLITVFGLMQYFNELEAKEIYKLCYTWIKPGGKIIIKNQFGVHQDIVISGYSEELKKNYYSHYRHLDKETALLEQCGFKNITIVDIYPPECNRWENTHFYAFVAEK